MTAPDTRLEAIADLAHVTLAHRQELLTSAIHPDIIALNFTSLEGNDPAEYLLYALKNSDRRNDGRLNAGLMKKYAHLEKGGWYCQGIDEWGCFKPDQPRKYQDGDKWKLIKYEHPPGTPTRLFRLAIPQKLALKIWINHCPDAPQPNDDFWAWVQANPVPIILTEGAKKAAALLSAGYCAIALPGITGGYRKTETGAKHLIPDLLPYCQTQREWVVAFDQDDKEKTVKNVNAAAEMMAKLLGGASRLVWSTPEKGIDDLIAARGPGMLAQVWGDRQPMAALHQDVQKVESMLTGLEGTEQHSVITQILDTLKSQIKELDHKISPKTKRDRTKAECNDIIERVREVVLCKALKPYERDYELEILSQQISRERGVRLTTDKLRTLYHKSLIKWENEPFKTIAQLREEVGDDVERWVTYGWFARGRTTLLHALGGVGKSLLMYDFIHAIVSGQNWNEFIVPKKQRVAIIQTDEARTDLLKHLDQRGFREHHDVLIKNSWSVSFLPFLYDELEAWKPDLVLVDSLHSVSAKEMVDENGTDFARPVLEFNDLADRLNCHVVMIHHSSKSEHGMARGSTALEAAAGQVLRFEKDKTDYATGELRKRLRLLTFTKSRCRRPAQYRLELKPDDNSWICLGEVEDDDAPADAAGFNSKRRIMNHLQQLAGLKYENWSLGETLGISPNTVRKYTKELAADGMISHQTRPGRSTLYWVEGEGDPSPLTDHQRITTPDHHSNSEPELNTAEGDPVIHEIDCSGAEENINLPDHRITDAQNPHDTKPEEVIRHGDPVVIRAGDPVAIDGEQSGRSPQQSATFKPDDVAVWRDPDNLFMTDAPPEDLPIVNIVDIDDVGAHCLSDVWDNTKVIPLDQLETI